MFSYLITVGSKIQLPLGDNLQFIHFVRQVESQPAEQCSLQQAWKANKLSYSLVWMALIKAESVTS